MPAIDYGTQFIGISADVPIPENRSSQNNSFQEVFTIDDISSYALPFVPDVLIQDFFVFASESNIVPFPSIIFKVNGKVNGFLEWTSMYNNIKYSISIDDGLDVWELYEDANKIALIDDAAPEQVPPSGDWDFDGDLAAVNILYVSGSIQEAIEQLAISITG
jgi:hypothetical protein